MRRSKQSGLLCNRAAGVGICFSYTCENDTEHDLTSLKGQPSNLKLQQYFKKVILNPFDFIDAADLLEMSSRPLWFDVFLYETGCWGDFMS